MVYAASFNGASDARMFCATVLAVVAAVIVGSLLKRPVVGFFAGGIVSALVAAIILATGEGDMVVLDAAILAPILGVIGGVVSVVAGAVAAKFSRRPNRNSSEDSSDVR